MSRPVAKPSLHRTDGDDDSGFRRILCGVDGSRPSREAVRQAVLLAGRGEIHFVAVSEVVGAGATRQALLTPTRASQALNDALAVAREAGVAARTEIVSASDPAKILLERGFDFDLLVLGSHGRSRLQAILVGTTAGVTLHRAAVPVWIARPTVGASFPGPVLAATRATPHDGPVVERAAHLAAHYDVPLTLVHVGAGSEAERHELAMQCTRAQLIRGSEPVVIQEPGNPAERILESATLLGAGLVVLGNGHRTGARALVSVSERVAAHTPGSVLVLRGS